MKFKALAVFAVLSLSAAGCGGNNAQVVLSNDEPIMENSAEASLSENESKKEESPRALDEEREPSEEDITVEFSHETYPGTVEAFDGEGNSAGSFGIMHAEVLGVWPDEAEGVNIYSLRDKNDTENTWSIPADQIGGIEADMTVGNEIAVAFKGDMINDYENVEFIAAIPEDNYLIASVTGTTLVNVMSSFSIRTESGAEMTFLKDNCEVEEDAMTGDAGESVTVYYAQSSEGVNYPLAVYKAGF